MRKKLVYKGKDENGDSIWVEDDLALMPGCRAAKDIVSDSLGCTVHNIEAYREDARKHGFHVDFVEDRGPSATEGFFPCKGSPSEIARYEKHRFNSVAEHGGAGASVRITAEELAAAERLVRRQHKEAA